MSEPFLGEIRIFAFNWPPQGWAICNGQPVPMQQFPALYAVIGKIYGGDASNFNLPNLMQKVPLGMGAGPGLTPRTIGKSGGEKTVTLTSAQMPPHSHTVNASDAQAGSQDPAGARIAKGYATSGIPSTKPRKLYNAMPVPANRAQLAPNALSGFPGGNAAHSNMQPSLTLSFCICTDGGIYPVPAS